MGSWERFLADADWRAVQAVSGGAVPGVVPVSASGMDVPNAVVLGGVAMMMWMLLRERKHEATGLLPGPSLPDIAPLKPPRDAKDPNGAKAPGKPGEDEDFQDPKDGEQWVKEPRGPRFGWLHADGSVWVPTGPKRKGNHGGPHWDVEYPNGKYRNVFPKNGRKEES